MLGGLSGAIALIGGWPTAVIALPEIYRIEQGTVQVRRQASGVYIYGRSGLPLAPRDALLPSAGARVWVDCPSGARQRVTPGRLSGVQLICPDLARSTDGRNEDDLLLLLAGEFPYSPRVLTDHPVFSWPDITPTRPYAVRVIQIEFVQPEVDDPFVIPEPQLVETVLYETAVASSHWRYDGPALALDRRYQIQVATETGVFYTMPFRGLTTEAEGAIGEVERSLVDQEPIFTDRAVALAYVYLEADLYGAVIATLQPEVEAGRASAIAHRLLAEGYLKTGVYGMAATHYGAAIVLAEEAADGRTQGEAWVGLAKVAAVSQKRERVVQRLEKAQRIYGGLAVDEGWVAAIEAWLAAEALSQE